MANAPRPGASQRLEADAAQAKMMDSGFTITCGAEGKKVTVVLGDLNSADEVACIAETGMSPFSLIEKAAEHTVACIFYWLGVRRLGDPRKLGDILETFGSPRAFAAGRFEMEVFGELAEEVEGADPTGPGAPSGTPGPAGPSGSDSTPGMPGDLQS